MRRKGQRARAQYDNSNNPQFHLHQESIQTNQAKAVLIEECVQSEPIRSFHPEPIPNCEALTSWDNSHRQQPLSCSYRAFEFLKHQETRVAKSIQSPLMSPVRNWNSARTTSQSNSRSHSNRMPLMHKNYSEIVKPTSSSSYRMPNESNFSATAPEFKKVAKPPRQNYIKKDFSRERSTSLSITTYLLKHLYKNKRQWELGCETKQKDSEMGPQAGLKGRRQHQVWKRQIRLLQ